MELWQAEWCPHSHKVRQRLTELGVEVMLRQVDANQDDRGRLEAATDQREIPALITNVGDVFVGEEEILPWLDEHFDEPRDAKRHRAKARAEVKDFEEVAG